MTTNSIPCVFAGDVLTEDASIASLIAKGRQEFLDAKRTREEYIAVAVKDIPESITQCLQENSVTIEFAHANVKTVTMTFDVTGLKQKIQARVYVELNTYGPNKGILEKGSSYFFYEDFISGCNLYTVATSLEHALYMASEVEKAKAARGIA